MLSLMIEVTNKDIFNHAFVSEKVFWMTITFIPDINFDFDETNILAWELSSA